MRDESDSFWRYLFFSAIGDSDNGDIVLQYYGNRFGPDPERAPYYLVIEMTRNDLCSGSPIRKSQSIAVVLGSLNTEF